MRNSLQFVANVLLLSAISLAQTTGKVSVTSPVSGSTVTSPVHFVASAQAPANHYITAMRIYVDYVSVYYVRAAKLDTYVSMTAGTHKLTVQAWDNSGTVYKQWLSLTVKASSVSVSISPTSAILQTGASYQFKAAVTGTTNTSVTWLVNGIQGGNSTVGTISSSGLYTAPAAVPSGSSVTVTAKSMADTTKSASASVTIMDGPTPVSVAISPTSVTLQGGQSKQFTASVTGTTNTSITWQVAGVTGGNSTVGRISSTGLYTAPACPAASAETVTARSVYDSNAYANATVTLSGSASAGTGGNYYVATNGSDSNDGSACHPWATIQHASNLAQPGWTVHVAPGTYNISSILTTTSGTASARIRYISDAQWGAKIIASTTEIAWEVDANYVDIVGFDITGPERVGIMIGNSGSGSGNDHIFGNNIHDLTVADGCTSLGGAAVATSFPPWGTGSNSILNNRVANIAVALIGSCNSIQGIYIGSANDIVENNIVSGVALAGIHQWHGATNSIIVNNTVFHSKVGILIGEGDSGVLSGGSANNYVANNIVVNNSAIGIQEFGLVGSGNSYVNNLVWNNPTNYSVTSASPVGTVSSDPLFVHYQADGSGDYHLQSISPAIDKGTNLRAPLKDFDGGARPVGATWDIGAYEEGATPAAWPWQ